MIHSFLIDCVVQILEYFSMAGVKKSSAVLRDVVNATDTGLVDQWVSSVIDFSSQYDNLGWSAQKVIGMPVVYPRYGDIRGAWAQGMCNENQFITVGFEKGVHLERLDIYETLNGGAIQSIKARKANGPWFTVYTGQASVYQEARIFSPQLQVPSFLVKEVRLELDCTTAGSWCELDAIKMVGRPSKISLPPPLTMLSHHLYSLVNNPEFSDVTFDVDGTLIHGHRAILSSRSHYFSAMFHSGMREAGGHVQPIKVKDVSVEAFIGLLQYLYTNTLASDICASTLLQLMRVADRYSAEGLDQLSFWYLNKDLTNDNIIPVYRSAVEQLPVLENVRELCLDYMADHMAEVAQMKAFTELPQHLMLEVIQHAASHLRI